MRLAAWTIIASLCQLAGLGYHRSPIALPASVNRLEMVAPTALKTKAADAAYASPVGIGRGEPGVQRGEAGKALMIILRLLSMDTKMAFTVARLLVRAVDMAPAAP